MKRAGGQFEAFLFLTMIVRPFSLIKEQKCFNHQMCLRYNIYNVYDGSVRGNWSDWHSFEPVGHFKITG